MIRKILNGEEHLISNDPVRPHIPFNERVGPGRGIFVLDDDSDKVRAVICVAYCKDIPTNELELKEYTHPLGNVAVFYTVWSYDKGAGREIVNEVYDLLKKETAIQRFVTLSPLTEMARKFHLSNGAKFLAEYSDCQNFEYSDS
jgi:hypothetical protein